MPLYTARNIANGSVGLPSPVERVLKRGQSVSFQSSLELPDQRWQSLIDTNLISFSSSGGGDSVVYPTLEILEPSDSGPLSIPSGEVWIFAGWGGGGGGGGGAATDPTQGGAGAGWSLGMATGPSDVTITVGSGGSGGADTLDGTDGEDTVVTEDATNGIILVAGGGRGGGKGWGLGVASSGVGGGGMHRGLSAGNNGPNAPTAASQLVINASTSIGPEQQGVWGLGAHSGAAGGGGGGGPGDYPSQDLDLTGTLLGMCNGTISAVVPGLVSAALSHRGGGGGAGGLGAASGPGGNGENGHVPGGGGGGGGASGDDIGGTGGNGADGRLWILKVPLG